MNASGEKISDVQKVSCPSLSWWVAMQTQVEEHHEYHYEYIKICT